MEDNLFMELKENPEKGLNVLMDTYIGFIHIIVKNKIGTVCSKEDIEECVSTVFYEFYSRRDSLDLSRGSIKAFLAVIAKRKAVDFYRTWERKNKEIPYSYEALDCSHDGDFAHRETKQVFIEKIMELGPPDSEIFIRKYYFGQSSKIIAGILNLKINTVDKKVSRGLEKLKKTIGGVIFDG